MIKIRKIDPDQPQPEHIDEASSIIKKGGVVSFPTRCLNGLGADALNPKAVRRIFEIKLVEKSLTQRENGALMTNRSPCW